MAEAGRKEGHTPGEWTVPDWWRAAELLDADGGSLTHQDRCLLALFDMGSTEKRCFPFAPIEERTGLDRTQVKRAVRRLARSGFAFYARCLWTDDGQPCGAGYGLTENGAYEARAAIARAEGA